MPDQTTTDRIYRHGFILRNIAHIEARAAAIEWLAEWPYAEGDDSADALTRAKHLDMLEIQDASEIDGLQVVESPDIRVFGEQTDAGEWVVTHINAIIQDCPNVTVRYDGRDANVYSELSENMRVSANLDGRLCGQFDHLFDS